MRVTNAIKHILDNHNPKNIKIIKYNDIFMYYV